MFVNNYRKEAELEPIILDAGDMFFASPVLVDKNLPADKLQAQALLNGYTTIGCDAINIGGYDLAAGIEFVHSLQEETTIPFISANLTDLNDELLFEPYRIVERNGITIGVTGVTNTIPEHIKNVNKRPFKETGNAVIQELRKQVDYVVLLANVKTGDFMKLADQFPDADYIFNSRATKRSRPVQKQAENGPYVYGSGVQGKYLSLIEVDMKDSRKPVTDISVAEEKVESIKKRLDRLKEKSPDQILEESYADKPNVLQLIVDYREQLAKYEEILHTSVNTTKYRSIALSAQVGEDETMMAFVDQTLVTCTQLRGKKINASDQIVAPRNKPIRKKININ